MCVETYQLQWETRKTNISALPSHKCTMTTGFFFNSGILKKENQGTEKLIKSTSWSYRNHIFNSQHPQPQTHFSSRGLTFTWPLQASVLVTTHPDTHIIKINLITRKKAKLIPDRCLHLHPDIPHIGPSLICVSYCPLNGVLDNM